MHQKLWTVLALVCLAACGTARDTGTPQTAAAAAHPSAGSGGSATIQTNVALDPNIKNPACDQFKADCATPQYYQTVNNDPNGPSASTQNAQGCAALKQEALDCVKTQNDGAPPEGTLTTALNDGSCGCSLWPNTTPPTSVSAGEASH